MISIVYCTRQPNPEHAQHLKKVAGHPDVEVIEYVNEGESLTKFYNRALEEAKYDIVVFTHDDVTIESKQIAKKLVRHYDSNPDYGILGVAGTKYLSDTGKWWENPRKMYGRVKHTHEGRSWWSNYSDDLGNDLEEVVVVDGVFFSVHKQRIKEEFDETVEGFHFYDVDLCFRNYTEGVRIGVHTNIKINHRSIGVTNDEWEKNRQIFSEKYDDFLPINIKRTVRPNERLKVLIGCLSFSQLTGSELYVYELAKELIQNNCEVTVCSNLGEPLASMATRIGIKLASIQEPPGFKMGDGKWGFDTPNGQVPSEQGKLYKIAEMDYDVIHLNHKSATEHLLACYPEIDTVCTIHSEVLPQEEPVHHNAIKKYIVIRPEIGEYISEIHGIADEKIQLVYNPIDYKRFKVSPNTQHHPRPRVIFVGTLDYIRKATLLDLIAMTRDGQKDLWIVGRENGVAFQDLINEAGGDTSHVSYHGPTSTPEKLVKQCDETAGILLGRTTIEGWMCGKGGWIYDVDSSGNILGKEFHPVPDDVDKFRSDVVAKQIIEVYKEAIE